MCGRGSVLECVGVCGRGSVLECVVEGVCWSVRERECVGG